MLCSIRRLRSLIVYASHAVEHADQFLVVRDQERRDQFSALDIAHNRWAITLSLNCIEQLQCLVYYTGVTISSSDAPIGYYWRNMRLDALFKRGFKLVWVFSSAVPWREYLIFVPPQGVKVLQKLHFAGF